MSDNYVEQAKILRVLLLIEQLRTRPMTIQQISKRYDITDRTSYRYIRLIEAVGILIDCNMRYQYFIFRMPKERKMRKKFRALHFEKREIRKDCSF